MRRNRCCSNRIGLYFTAFGLGMLISLMCPKTFVVAVLSIVIVVLGIIVAK